MARRQRTGRTMPRLTVSQLQATIAAMEAASAAHLNGDHGAFDRWLKAYGEAPARLEFPLGELMNQRVRGFVWAWGMCGAIQTEGLTARDGFDAQGLEGKAVVEVQLVTALLVARDLPQHQVAVHAWTLEAEGARMNSSLDPARLQAAREQLIRRDADYLDRDRGIAQFALDLAGEKLQESGAGEVLDSDDYEALVETVATAIATGMHVALEVTGTALDQIQATLSGQEWSPDTLDRVAELVRATAGRSRTPLKPRADSVGITAQPQERRSCCHA